MEGEVALGLKFGVHIFLDEGVRPAEPAGNRESVPDERPDE